LLLSFMKPKNCLKKTIKKGKTNWKLQIALLKNVKMSNVTAIWKKDHEKTIKIGTTYQKQTLRRVETYLNNISKKYFQNRKNRWAIHTHFRSETYLFLLGIIEICFWYFRMDFFVSGEYRKTTTVLKFDNLVLKYC
jgi:acyl-coenzyme A synthetase/AMP-(fatty) acid ligase